MDLERPEGSGPRLVQPRENKGFTGGKMPHEENDLITYHDGQPDLQEGRIEEARDQGPHAVYRVRNAKTNEIQVITQGQID
ncbi:hypothetical protein ACFYNM_19850 [Streptomyces spororaveus]|uniref:hypothetical protein n=1 Tax=Streptomyces spororaveus TaxID=284039 RepID=UPI0036946BB0